MAAPLRGRAAAEAQRAASNTAAGGSADDHLVRSRANFAKARSDFNRLAGTASGPPAVAADLKSRFETLESTFADIQWKLREGETGSDTMRMEAAAKTLSRTRQDLYQETSAVLDDLWQGVRGDSGSGRDVQAASTFLASPSTTGRQGFSHGAVPAASPDLLRDARPLDAGSACHIRTSEARSGDDNVKHALRGIHADVARIERWLSHRLDAGLPLEGSLPPAVPSTPAPGAFPDESSSKVGATLDMPPPLMHKSYSKATARAQELEMLSAKLQRSAPALDGETGATPCSHDGLPTAKPAVGAFAFHEEFQRLQAEVATMVRAAKAERRADMPQQLVQSPCLRSQRRY
mmetsp:Transcript_11759/g.21402  ORF Transcript_11759/g.21402 Transcript_11759/m.21402 type:complete len:348 (+) Transcript_11759:46-1089(+)